MSEKCHIELERQIDSITVGIRHRREARSVAIRVRNQNEVEIKRLPQTGDDLRKIRLRPTPDVDPRTGVQADHRLLDIPE